MNYLASNLKVLRARHSLSQAAFAEKMNVSRANIAKYEGAVHEPPISILIKMSRYFTVSLDDLIIMDLSRINDEALDSLQNRTNRIFPIQVDQNGADVIEVVPHNAQAGYNGQYGDVGFIESLEHITLPMIANKGKCRAFPIAGDSMPPYADGTYVVGEFIEHRSHVKEGERYILLSRDEGIVFKRLFFDPSDKGKVILHSDNPVYKPFEMRWNEVVEIWKWVAAVSVNEAESSNSLKEMKSKIENLQKDLKIFSDQFTSF